MNPNFVVFNGVSDYLRTEPFELKTDFGNITYLPGVSGNYFPVKPMKNKNSKKKNKKPTMRWLQSRIKQIEKAYENLAIENYKQSEELLTVSRERDNAKQIAEDNRNRYQRQTKMIGLYFAALNSECSTTTETLNYLRQLRSEIFN